MIHSIFQEVNVMLAELNAETILVVSSLNSLHSWVEVVLDSIGAYKNAVNIYILVTLNSCKSIQIWA